MGMLGSDLVKNFNNMVQLAKSGQLNQQQAMQYLADNGFSNATITGAPSDSGFDVGGTVGDAAKKLAQTNEINTGYDTALNALKGSEATDVSDYQMNSPLQQRKLLGILNARGLGSSVLAGGSGSGAMTGLATSQQKGLAGIQGGYQDLVNNLDISKSKDTLDLNNFYTQLAQMRTKARNEQAGPFDYLAAIPGMASTFIK